MMDKNTFNDNLTQREETRGELETKLGLVDNEEKKYRLIIIIS